MHRLFFVCGRSPVHPLGVIDDADFAVKLRDELLRVIDRSRQVLDMPIRRPWAGVAVAVGLDEVLHAIARFRSVLGVMDSTSAIRRPIQFMTVVAIELPSALYRGPSATGLFR